MNRLLPLTLALLLILSTFTACQPDDDREIIYESQITAENDGEPAALTVAACQWDAACKAALQDIVERYRADFPETQVRIKEYPDKKSLDAAAQNGEADIIQVQGEDIKAYAQSGALMDMIDYKGFWDYEGMLTEPARRAMHSMGPERLYAIPADFTQNLFFYRKDWFEGYNKSVEINYDKAYCQRWSQVLETAWKLGGDRAKIAMDKNKMVDFFHSVIWSGMGAGAPVDLSAVYFGKGDPQDTVFTNERFPEVMATFVNVQAMLLDGGMDSEEEAVEAFMEGRSAYLLADSSAARALSAAMPPDSWSSAGMPLGELEDAVSPFGWWGWGLSAHTNNREKALHFLCYMTNCDNNTHLAQECGYLPIYREAVFMEPRLSEGGRAIEVMMLRDASAYRYATGAEMYEASEGFADWLGGRLADLQEDELSEQALTAQLDGYWLEAFGKEGKLWIDEEEE